MLQSVSEDRMGPDAATTRDHIFPTNARAVRGVYHGTGDKVSAGEQSV